MLGDVAPIKPIEREGQYKITGNKLVIAGDKEPPFDRMLLDDKGTIRLLRRDAQELWTNDGRLYPYGTLTRVPNSFEEMRPSADFDKKKWEILIPKLPTLVEKQ